MTPMTHTRSTSEPGTNRLPITTRLTPIAESAWYRKMVLSLRNACRWRRTAK